MTTAVLAAALIAALVALIATARLLHQAMAELLTDPLTGLPNRRALYARLDAHHRHLDLIVVAIIDLDGFKQVNDVHGHDTGDQVLVEVARRLTMAIPAGGMVARLGGDEFAATWLLDRTSPATADDMATTVAATILTNGHSVRVGASIGATTACYEPREVALHAADMAMFAAKRAGTPVVWAAPAHVAVAERPTRRLRDLARRRDWRRINETTTDRARWSA